MKFLDYIRGFRKGKNARFVEQESMNDPFLADAIDGYDSINGNHADKITQMQARVSSRTVSVKKKSGAWKIAVAAVLFIAFLGGYFTLMNHESAMLTAHEQGNTYINLYIPEAYIEQKSLELGEIKELGSAGKAEITAVVDIENLDEVIKPVERIKIYIPEAYAQLKKEELEELSSTRERRSDIEQLRDADVVREDIIKPEASKPEVMIAEASPVASPSPSETWMLGASVNRTTEEKTDSESFFTKEYSSKLTALDDNNAGKVSGNFDRLTKETPISSTLASKSIGIRPSNKLLTGMVVDEDNEPIIGASVKVKGTNKGVITDIDGHYELNLDSSDKADLIADYLGYETIEIPEAKDNQVIAMKASRQLLDEVVVVGYGTTKKSHMTGSVSAVQTDRLSVQKEPVPQPANGMKEYRKYLKNNMIKPVSSECEVKKGTIILVFNVNDSGRPVDIIVQKSLCEAFDKEAIRLLEAGPDWTMGSQKGLLDVEFK